MLTSVSSVDSDYQVSSLISRFKKDRECYIAKLNAYHEDTIQFEKKFRELSNAQNQLTLLKHNAIQLASDLFIVMEQINHGTEQLSAYNGVATEIVTGKEVLHAFATKMRITYGDLIEIQKELSFDIDIDIKSKDTLLKQTNHKAESTTKAPRVAIDVSDMNRRNKKQPKRKSDDLDIYFNKI